MDEQLGRFHVFFNSISVMSGQLAGKYERLCAVKLYLDSDIISPSAGLKPGTLCH